MFRHWRNGSDSPSPSGLCSRDIVTAGTFGKVLRVVLHKPLHCFDRIKLTVSLGLLLISLNHRPDGNAQVSKVQKRT